MAALDAQRYLEPPVEQYGGLFASDGRSVLASQFVAGASVRSSTVQKNGIAIFIKV